MFKTTLDKTTLDSTPLADEVPAEQTKAGFLHHLWASFAATVILVIICCGVYPLIVWSIAQAAFPNQANGSLVKKDGTFTTKDEEAVGSALLGQNFGDSSYFHPRPSSAGAGYDAASSSGSNLGPLSAKLVNGATKTVSVDGKDVEQVDFDGIKLRTLLYALDAGIEVEVLAGPPLDTFKNAKGDLDQVKLIKAFNDADHPSLFRAKSPIPADAVTASGSGLDPHISPQNAALQAQRVADARKISKEKVMELIKQNTDAPSLGIFGDPGVNVLMLNLALDKTAPISAPVTAPASTSNSETVPASASK